MSQLTADENESGREASSVIDRETFRKVVRQRQKMKAELRQLQEKMSALPQDWAQRMPGWLELEKAAGEEVPEGVEAPSEPGPESAEESGNGLGDEEIALAPEDFGEQPVSRESSGVGQPVEPPDWVEKEKRYRQEIAELTLTGMIREAAREMGAYDPQDVVDLTRGFFSAAYEDGAITMAPGPALKGVGGEVSLSDKDQEFTLKGVISAFLQGKPHLVRAGFRPGSGLVSGPNNLLAGQAPDREDPARTMLQERLRVQNRLG